MSVRVSAVSIRSNKPIKISLKVNIKMLGKFVDWKIPCFAAKAPHRNGNINRGKSATSGILRYYK